MIRGITKRVIVVKSPDPNKFEEAIFIVREEFFPQSGAERVRPSARSAEDSKRLRRYGKREIAFQAACYPLCHVRRRVYWSCMAFYGNFLNMKPCIFS